MQTLIRLKHNKTQKSLGMTLVEVVMALAVLSVLLVVAYGSLSSISKSKRNLDDYQDVYLVAQSLLRRITRELQLVTCDKGSDLNCIKGKGLLPPPDKENDKSGALLIADQNGSGKESSITFLAMEAGQYLMDGGAKSGIVQITYRLGKEDQNDKLYTLVRDEIPYLSPAAEAYKKRISFPLTKNVVSLSFAFYDHESDAWMDEWGTKPGTTATLPSLIKFALVLRSGNGIDLPFETIVPVRTIAQR